MKTSLLIPAKNEAKNLPYVLTKIPESISEVILIDGGSTDDTINVAKKLYPELKIVEQKNSKGKGNAIMEGLEVAKGEYLILMDADGSMNPNELELFIDKTKNGFDLVKGSRFLEEGGTDDMTRFRKFGNWVFVKMVNLLYKKKFTDLCYGFLAIKRDLLKELGIESRNFSIEAEIIAKASKINAKIVEIPSYELNRLHGSSNLRAFKDGFSIFWTIIKLRFSN